MQSDQRLPNRGNSADIEDPALDVAVVKIGGNSRLRRGRDIACLWTRLRRTVARGCERENQRQPITRSHRRGNWNPRRSDCPKRRLGRAASRTIERHALNNGSVRGRCHTTYGVAKIAAVSPTSTRNPRTTPAAKPTDFPGLVDRCSQRATSLRAMALDRKSVV